MWSLFVSPGHLVTPRGNICFSFTIVELIGTQPLRDLRDHFSQRSTQSGVEAPLHWCGYTFSSIGSLGICLVEPTCSCKPPPYQRWISLTTRDHLCRHWDFTFPPWITIWTFFHVHLLHDLFLYQYYFPLLFFAHCTYCCFFGHFIHVYALYLKCIIAHLCETLFLH